MFVLGVSFSGRTSVSKTDNESSILSTPAYLSGAFGICFASRHKLANPDSPAES